MAQPSDVNVDDLRRRARRRLVGAIVLALSAAVFVPMLLESEPKPLGEDVSVKIPPVDNGKFVNKLNAKGGSEPGKAGVSKADAAKVDAAKADAAKAQAALTDTTVTPVAPADGAPARSASTSTPPITLSSNVPAPPKRSLAEAEQRVLSASGKAATPVTPPAVAPMVPPPVATSAVAPKVDAAKAAPAKVEPAKPEATKSATDGPGFSVQLFAFTDDKGANSLANKLKAAGYPAYTEPVASNKGTLWRVRVGPFPTRDAAGASRDKLKGDGYSGIVAPAK
ncbi:MAG: SPOR domain-containing protein [Betaproteobacteria bacterium]